MTNEAPIDQGNPWDKVRHMSQKNEALRAEIERLTLENWQLKRALGYPVPGNVPEGPFKCGLCEARALEAKP